MHIYDVVPFAEFRVFISFSDYWQSQKHQSKVSAQINQSNYLLVLVPFDWSRPQMNGWQWKCFRLVQVQLSGVFCPFSFRLLFYHLNLVNKASLMKYLSCILKIDQCTMRKLQWGDQIRNLSLSRTFKVKIPLSNSLSFA